MPTPTAEKEPAKFPENFVQKVEKFGALAMDPSEGITKADVDAFKKNTAAQLEHLKPFDAFIQRTRIIERAEKLEKTLTDEHKDIKDALKILRTETQKLQPLQGKFGVKYVEGFAGSMANSFVDVPPERKESHYLGLAVAGSIILPLTWWLVKKMQGKSSSILKRVLMTVGLGGFALATVAALGNPGQKAAAEALLQKQKESKVAKLPKEKLGDGEYVDFAALPANLTIAQNGEPLKEIPRTYLKYTVDDKEQKKPFYFYKENNELRVKIGLNEFRVTAQNMRDGRLVEVPAIQSIVKDAQGGLVVIGPLAKNGESMGIRLSAEQIQALAKSGEALNPTSFTSDMTREGPAITDPGKLAELQAEVKNKYGGNVESAGGKTITKIPLSISFSPIVKL